MLPAQNIALEMENLCFIFIIFIINFVIRLECSLDAYPPPVVTWYVNGMEIKPSPHYEILYEQGKSILLIIEVGPEDTGEYTCRALSEMGEAVCSTTLYVQGKSGQCGKTHWGWGVWSLS